MNLPQIVPKTETIPYFFTTGDDLVSSFLRGRNQKTIEAYRKDLEDFRSFLGASTIDDASKILLSKGPGEANALALAYKTHLIERGLQSATVNRRLAALRSLVKLARTLGLTVYTLQVENMKSQPYRDTKGPGKNGYRAMLDQAKKAKEAKAIRDQAMLHLLYDMGLRRGEVISLDLTDLDLMAGTVSVLGKGRTQKESLTLPNETKKALSEWLKVRGATPGALFLNFDPSASEPGRLTGDGLYKIIKKLGKKAGIKARPHGLRHSAITEALDLTGGNIRAVARFSRHRNIQVLTLYDDNRTDLGGNVAQMVAAGAFV
jgi:integrase/recombinase XerC